ncbi:MAG: sulfite exporter TauE/SafE family protein [Desulfovibrionaceae bacterium]|nr:sulfite exporter TauE/SafE family protein [Desulfovibrionaceae bacterium]
MIACLVCAAVLVGALIGTVGVGGILLIPALSAFAGLDTHQAMATALFSFIFTGILGTWLYQRHGSIDWHITLPVCAGGLVAGYFGSLANAYTSPTMLNILLSGVIIFAGIYALFPAKSRPIRTSASLPVLFAIGAAVGFGSGLTGVGGPVLSVPLMVILGFHPLTSIATSQVIQIAAACSGSLGNMGHGFIHFQTALWVTGLELIGVFAGVRLAHAIPASTLKKIVSVVCIIVGTFILIRTVRGI